MAKSIYTEEHNEIIKIIVDKRKKLGIKQIDMAKKLDISQSNYSRIENGHIKIDLVLFFNICSVLGIDSIRLLKLIFKNFGG